MNDHQNKTLVMKNQEVIQEGRHRTPLPHLSYPYVAAVSHFFRVPSPPFPLTDESPKILFWGH